MDFDQYEALTLADILEDGVPMLVSDTPDTTTYLVRNGNVVRTVAYHKTVASVMAANASEAAEFSRTSKLGENVKVASMPMSVYLDLHAQGIVQDKAEYKKWLNNSDNAWARVNNLRV
ncbi:hypothetical protein [Rhizobium sp.]|uniref:hypothetical protein n=1 Tax=Rhizobium sp. TaxID=391 RepID=UPI0034C6BA94